MSARNIKLQGLDEMFSTEEMRQDDKRERVIELSPEELKPFQDHPFQVREDAELQKLVESIKEYGVMTPLIARQMDDGLAWDERAKDWVDINACPTPEDLRDTLLDGYENFTEYHITYGKRKLTEADKATIQEKLQAMRTRLGE